MSPVKMLWQEGPFSCELRTTIDPPHIVVTKDGEDVVEVVARSQIEIEESAAELLAFILTHRRNRDGDPR